MPIVKFHVVVLVETIVDRRFPSFFQFNNYLQETTLLKNRSTDRKHLKQAPKFDVQRSFPLRRNITLGMRIAWWDWL